MPKYVTYILLCSDGSYYTGITNNLQRRLQEHHDGVNLKCYTFSRRPLQLAYYEKYEYVQDAILREKQLKKWSRAKKQALINENQDLLHELSIRYSRKKR